MDGFVRCPLRGELPVGVCAVCPFRTRTERSGERVVVVCEPEAQAADLVWTVPVAGVTDTWW